VIDDETMHKSKVATVLKRPSRATQPRR